MSEINEVSAVKFQNSINENIPKIKDLIYQSIPQLLLGDAYCRLQASTLNTKCGSEAPYESEVVLRLLEYAHAVYASTHPNVKAQQLKPDEYDELIKLVSALYKNSMHHAIFARSDKSIFAGDDAAQLELMIKSHWMGTRRNRYNQHELLLMRHALEPHSEVIQEIYSLSFESFMSGFAKIHQAVSYGFAQQLETAKNAYQICVDIAHKTERSIGEAINEFISDEKNPEAARKSLLALWLPDYLNISEITKWPQSLIDDLAFKRGEVDYFFDKGDMNGWLLKALPCRWKPFLQLDDGSYAFEPTFAIEAIYRAVQRGIMRKLPTYQETWNNKQKIMAENIFPLVFEHQLKSATIYQEVYYQLDGKWRECDCIIIIDDIMLVIEAKAGAYSLASIDKDCCEHLARLKGLICHAYTQAENFLKYLDSGNTKPIFEKQGRRHVQIADLTLNKYRLVVPIGLTVENLSPMTGILNTFSEMQPILTKHQFLAMSIDDLFPLNELLTTTGELMHYLEVRQAAALHPKLRLFDEMDHLGSYIQHNRYDNIVSIHLDYDQMVLSGMSDIIDRYYYELTIANQEASSATKTSPPAQIYPEEYVPILNWIENNRITGWLSLNSCLRNLSCQQREEFARQIRVGFSRNDTNIFYVNGVSSVTIIQSFTNCFISENMIYDIGSASASAFGTNLQLTVHLLYDYEDHTIQKVTFCYCCPPTVVQANYSVVMSKAVQIRDLAEKEKLSQEKVTA